MNRFMQLKFRTMLGLLLVLPMVATAQTTSETGRPPIQGASETPAHGAQSRAQFVIGGPQVTLDDLIDVALEQNPSIKSAAEKYQAQQARVPHAFPATTSKGVVAAARPAHVRFVARHHRRSRPRAPRARGVRR